ncbi:MAG: leucine-rich repeat domain-containing protein [Actinomycetes bacterium]
MLDGTRTRGNTKALLFTAIALVLSATAFTSPALADYGDSVSGALTYTDDGSAVTITGCEHKFSCPTRLIIPESIDSMPVTDVAPFAFAGESGIEVLELPNTLITIGEEAFQSDTKLGSINIPDSVRNMGDSAFSGCWGSTSITIGEGLTQIPNRAFSYDSALQNLSLPNTLITIGEEAFLNASALENLTIPATVTSIGSLAFGGLGNLRAVIFKGNAPTVANDTFFLRSSGAIAYRNSTLTGYGNDGDYFPAEYAGDTRGLPVHSEFNYYVEGGHATFMGCALVRCSGNFIVPYEINGYPVTEIGYGAFQGATHLTTVNIPGTVTAIGGAAFQGATALYSLSIPSSVTAIGEEAFQGATHLTTVNFSAGSTLTAIAARSFYGDTSLTDINIPNSVTNIGERAFSDNTSLTSITIPNSVTSIGDQAFSGSQSLATVVFTGNPPSVGDDAFYNVASGAKAQRVPTLLGYGEAGSDFYGLVVSDGLGWAWPLTPARPVVTVTKTGITLKTSVETAGAGVLSQVATTKVGHLLATWCKTSRSALRPGTYTLTCKLSSHARTTLRKAAMNITLKTTLALTRGKKANVTQAVHINRTK